MKLKLMFLALFIGNICMGQSFFKSLPKVHSRLNEFGPKATYVIDSTFTGFRPIVTAAAYGYTSGQSSLFTGAGFSYEKDTWDVVNLKWKTNWSIAALVYAGGTFAPTSPQTVVAFGPSISFLNKLISVGAAYNVETKSIMPTFGFSVSLNN
jgi:hypothetical protein